MRVLSMNCEWVMWMPLLPVENLWPRPFLKLQISNKNHLVDINSNVCVYFLCYNDMNGRITGIVLIVLYLSLYPQNYCSLSFLEQWIYSAIYLSYSYFCPIMLWLELVSNFYSTLCVTVKYNGMFAFWRHILVWKVFTYYCYCLFLDNTTNYLICLIWSFPFSCTGCGP